MRGIKALIFSFAILCLPALMKQPFKVPPSHPEIKFEPAWVTPPPDLKILSILNQSFAYLAHGNQSTVFASEDGEYVLKLFRYTRPRFRPIQNLKSSFATWRDKKPKNDRFTKAHKTFTAAHLAYTEAQEYTHVVFCHLNLTQNQLPTVELKANRTYRLPLDRYRFVIQKKVRPFKQTLLLAKNNPDEMHRLIDSFFFLVLNRSSLGIRNSDPNLGPNFGFLGEQAVEIDFGNYRKAPQSDAEINSYFDRFEHWLEKNAPEYIGYLKNLRRNIPFRMMREDETTEKFCGSQGTIH